MSKIPVSLVKCHTYGEKETAAAVDRAVDLIGGVGRFVKPGERILLKINLLRGAPPERAVTTHPEIVRAAISLVRRAGGVPIVGDSPGGVNTAAFFERALKVSGIKRICDETDTEYALLDLDIRTLESPQSRLYKKFEAAGLLHDVDGVISLPKLKTHGFMKFTCAVKVLFGVLPAKTKIEFHFKVPARSDFADMLVDLYRAVGPRLAIVDAVLAMSGDGPGHGDPYPLGAVLASEDALAVDVIAGRLIGFEPTSVYTTAAGIERGLIDPDAVEVIGEPLDALVVNDFAKPSRDFLDDLPPNILGLVPVGLGRRIKDIATARPILGRPDKCTACGTCRDLCPVVAIDLSRRKPAFNHSSCIRCYCCEELCPEGAIERANHWLVRPFTRFARVL